MTDITIDGQTVQVDAGSSLLDACRSVGLDQPTLCHLSTLTPANACRLCVVEVEGTRPLVPSCSRTCEDGMVVSTDSERVRHSRRMVLELLASSVDVGLHDQMAAWIDEYGADPDRHGADAATVAQPVRVDNDLYVRDYSRCILCYRCVDACGEDAQNTFAIQVAGRGFDATISTEHDVALPDSACVYCGNCIDVCPTDALMFRSEHELRGAGLWDESRQEVTRTVCAFCGVGCNLELHVQDERIVKVTSPRDHDVTSGHLCIKGRFGYDHVQDLDESTPVDEVLRAARRSGPV